MAITTVSTLRAVFSGDPALSGTGIEASQTNSNAVAIGAAYTSLASGANTITKPTANTVIGVWIIPAAGNTTSLTVKGVTSDTGVRIHDTYGAFLYLDTSVATFCLTAGAATTVKLVWV